MTISRKEQVIINAESKVGTEYYWGPFGPKAPGLLAWAYNMITVDKIGKSKEYAICCFDFVLLCAIEKGYINKDGYKTIFKQIDKDHGKIRKAMTSKSKWPLLGDWVWNDWPNPFWTNMTFWRPRRGDVVTFEGSNRSNHVVLSCGPDKNGFINVVSFGEGLSDPARAKVSKFTIAWIRKKVKSINSVKFFDPVWS